MVSDARRPGLRLAPMRPQPPSYPPRSEARKREIRQIAADLPDVSPIVQAAILEYLSDGKEAGRVPEKTAAILALIAELDKVKRPFPVREAVAIKLDTSVYTIDSAIATQLVRKNLSMDERVREGNTRARPGVVRERHYAPTPVLRDVIASARRREARRLQSGDD